VDGHDISKLFLEGTQYTAIHKTAVHVMILRSEALRLETDGLSVMPGYTQANDGPGPFWSKWGDRA
jgi:hypothetical protein